MIQPESLRAINGSDIAPDPSYAQIHTYAQ